MPRILQKRRATLDIVELLEYIEDRSGDARANAFSLKIKQTFEKLSRNPTMGIPRDDLKPGLRSHPVGKYIIYYYPLADGIDIVRFRHGARDSASLFVYEDFDEEK